MKIVRPLNALIVAALCSQLQSAGAQQSTSPILPVFNHIVDAQGKPPTGLGTPLFRAGTNPLMPLTRRNGDPITAGEFIAATGQVHIAARPGGGTDVNLDVQGLFPGETYSIWAGYFQDPGFLVGMRVGFGGATAIGDGSDVAAVADANGAISLDLVLREGPMTVHGNAPSYAPMSPILDSSGVLRSHTGFNVAIAYHFNNPPNSPFLGPPPADKFALQAVGKFAAITVPEPSSIALGLLASSCFAVFRRRPASVLCTIFSTALRLPLRRRAC
jgi:hypothetical protein